MADETLDLQAELDARRKAVDTEYFDLSIREIVRMVEVGEITVAPSYQRKFRWKEDVQSALIESLLLGLPIPAIFVATNKDGTWDVVDGLQRIATILKFFAIDTPGSPDLQFASSPLILTEMSQLGSFEGKGFNDLPMPIRLMLGKRYIRVQVLSDKSDVDVRFELFRRLNAGAVALTPQEIRSCVFMGTFNTLIDELAELSEFQDLLNLKPLNRRDGTAAEIVLKFFAYLEGMEQFDGKVTKFLNEYMKRRNNDTDLRKDQDLFMDTVKFLRSVMDGEFVPTRGGNTPLNRLEAVLVGLGKILKSGKKPKVPKAGWIDDKELVSASSSGTNSRSMLRRRVQRAQELFS